MIKRKDTRTSQSHKVRSGRVGVRCMFVPLARALFGAVQSVAVSLTSLPGTMGSLQAIRYQRGSLELLDQLRLPFESVFIPIKSCKDAFLAIKDMNVRGAPAIAISAVLSLAVDLSGGGVGRFATKEEAVKYVKDQLAYLVTR